MNSPVPIKKSKNQKIKKSKNQKIKKSKNQKTSSILRKLLSLKLISNLVIKKSKNKKFKRLNFLLKKKNKKLNKLFLSYFVNYYYIYNKRNLGRRYFYHRLKDLRKISKIRRDQSFSFLTDELVLLNKCIYFSCFGALFSNLLSTRFSKVFSSSKKIRYHLNLFSLYSILGIFKNKPRYSFNKKIFNKSSLKKNLNYKYSKIINFFSLNSYNGAAGSFFNDLVSKKIIKFSFYAADKLFKKAVVAISMCPWGFGDNWLYNKYLLKKRIRKFKLFREVNKIGSVHKYIYTNSKKYNSYFKNFNLFNFRRELALFSKKWRGIKLFRSKRRRWYPVFKAGKYWHRFKKKPYNWVSRDWLNKFYRYVKRPLNSVLTSKTTDIIKYSVYRSKTLKSCFKSKFIMKRYLKRTLFNNKMKSLVQFLKNKYKKKKCTFFEKTYNHLFGKLEMVLCWYGFSKSILGAKKLINNRLVLVNGSIVTNSKFFVYPSDAIFVKNIGFYLYNRKKSFSNLLLLRKLKYHILRLLDKRLSKLGLQRRLKIKIYSWWKRLARNLGKSKVFCRRKAPKWFLLYFKNFKLDTRKFKDISFSMFFSIINLFYFKRHERSLHQNIFDKKSKNSKSVGSELLFNEPHLKNFRAMQAEKSSFEEALSDFSFNYVIPQNKELLKLRYNVVTYKSSSGTLLSDGKKIGLDNYFKLSKFKRNKFSKNMYMFYLSRIFY